MPDSRVHRYVDKMLFGRTFSKIHKELDKHFKTHGRRHRRINHDPASAVQIALKLYPNDPVAINAALFHLQIDEICSQDSEFRKLLEFMARFGKK